ncbi:MAG TPA: L-rhamnose mutarotase [Gryllotalpicola sp.]
MRLALHSTLRPGHEDAYERDHLVVPDELAETFARIGIHDWQIWREGIHLFHVLECDDFDAAMTALDADEANRRWQAFIGAHVEGFLPDGDPRPIRPVWHLAEQRGAR